MVFESFSPVAPMPESTVQTFGPRVPPEIVQAWRGHGIGFVGDGYFRLVDPARAQAMLGGLSPAGGVGAVLFTTAMADLIVYANGMFLVVKARLGQIHPTSVSFEQVVALMADTPGQRDAVWDWQPYPSVRDRLGVPAFEDCFMHVPLLAAGGRGDPTTMQTGNLWVHYALMLQIGGPPKITHMLALPREWRSPAPAA